MCRCFSTKQNRMVCAQPGSECSDVDKASIDLKDVSYFEYYQPLSLGRVVCFFWIVLSLFWIWLEDAHAECRKECSSKVSNARKICTQKEARRVRYADKLFHKCVTHRFRLLTSSKCSKRQTKKCFALYREKTIQYCQKRLQKAYLYTYNRTFLCYIKVQNIRDACHQICRTPRLVVASAPKIMNALVLAIQAAQRKSRKLEGYIHP